MALRCQRKYVGLCPGIQDGPDLLTGGGEQPDTGARRESRCASDLQISVKKHISERGHPAPKCKMAKGWERKNFLWKESAKGRIHSDKL